MKIDAYGANLYASVAMFQIMKIDAYGGNLGSPLATNWHRNTGCPSIEAEVCDQCFGICWKCISKKILLTVFRNILAASHGKIFESGL